MKQSFKLIRKEAANKIKSKITRNIGSKITKIIRSRITRSRIIGIIELIYASKFSKKLGFVLSIGCLGLGYLGFGYLYFGSKKKSEQK